MPSPTSNTKTEIPVNECLKINTIYEFAEPKEWVMLPLYKNCDGYVLVFDAYGNKVKIVTDVKRAEYPIFGED